MRIVINGLFVVPNQVGGSERYLRGLVEGLARVDAGNQYILCLGPETAPTFHAPNERWRILPCGGVQNIPTFVALLGSHLEVSVLIDSGTQGAQRLTDLASRGLLDLSRLVTVGEITNSRNADIEDVFDVDDYLVIFNATLGTSLTEADLPPGDRIVRLGADLRRHQRAARGAVVPAARRADPPPRIREPRADAAADRWDRSVRG